MADFRRSIFVLSALAVAFGAATTASAQNFNCVASVANPPLLRAEGLTELTGDVVLGCSGGPTTPIQVNVQVFLNTNVTSRLLANGLTEALLLVNDPTGVPNAQVLGQNIYQGTLVASNSVAFLGVVLPAQPAGGGSLTLRITNLRANANALGVSGPSAPPNPVIETISITSGVTVANPNQTVGFVTRGLLAPSFSGAVGFQQCQSTGAVSSGIAAPKTANTITITEGFATAFKVQGGGGPTAVPGTVNNTESGLIPAGTSSAIGGAGQADTNTRIQLTFTGVGNGATVLVPTQVTEVVNGATVGVLNLVSGASSTTGTLSYLTTTSGVATAVYDVAQSQPSAIDAFAIPVSLSFVANPTGNSPVLGPSSVGVSFAPVSTATTATTGPIPRFANTSTTTGAFSITACATNLLFPFMTNIAGFDTGLAISNTSTDPFGTAAQTGTCQMNFYGSGAPGTKVPATAAVASGASFTTLLSTMAPGFQGYMIATCQFQYGHGFAFITDGFGGPGRGLSQGYLALVIPDTTITGGRTATPLGLGGAQAGEELAQ
ncbi:MAG: hypothetical protein ACR2I2_03480 [Bryobacteraceae bacterium]